MAKNSREFLMLANEYDASSMEQYVSGAFCSEKLDGMRCLWVPTTVGMEVRKVPFANLQKDATSNAGRAASGLWSRYGNPIWAPDEWVRHLPHDLILDGELWSGRGKFQDVMSTARKREGIWEEWQWVNFMVFDNPPLRSLFTTGKIHNNQWKHFVFPTTWPEWMSAGLIEHPTVSENFETTYFKLKKYLQPNDILFHHEQTRLSYTTDVALRQLDQFVDNVFQNKGEGCMLRQPGSIWQPYRSKNLLKVKPVFDSEGTVIDWEPGKGRLVGMMGSLRLKWTNPLGKQVVFNLSGFTDVERTLEGESCQFPEGTRITFKYRELTEDGCPKEARFFRVRHLDGLA